MKNKKTILAILFSLSLAFFTIPAKADEYGLDIAAGEAELPKVSNLPGYIGNAIGAFLSIISAIFFVLTLYAGIRWMIARGNEEEETKAKDTIIGAVIGMVIIMASYALTNFIFKGTMGQPPEKSDLQSPAVPNIKYCLATDAGTGELNCNPGGGSPCDGEEYPTLNECSAKIKYCASKDDDLVNTICRKQKGNEKFCLTTHPIYDNLATCEAAIK